MSEFLRPLEDLNPILQALIATLFTWGVTALGAAGVFFVREFNRKLLDSMMGFAAGVMIAVLRPVPCPSLSSKSWFPSRRRMATPILLLLSALTGFVVMMILDVALG